MGIRGRDRRLVVSQMLMCKLLCCASISVEEVSCRRILFQAGAPADDPPTAAQVLAHKKLPGFAIVIGVVSLVLAIALLVITAIGFFQNRCEQQAHMKRILLMSKRERETPGMESSTPLPFSYKEVESGTENFTQELFGGKLCQVYEGVLSNNTDVIIKRLPAVDYPRSQLEEDVRHTEGLHHGNLLPLLGYCSEGDHRLLIYKLLANGSLPSYIYPGLDHSESLLSWMKRFRILLGTGRALTFLHAHCQSERRKLQYGRIVHAENIFLTENYDPKLAWFGFTSPIDRDRVVRLASSSRGTSEYFAPEWWTADPGSSLTPKADVYSFGILLLEVVGGKRIGHYYKNPGWEFPDLASSDGEESPAFKDLLDPELRGRVNMEQLRAAIHAAYWCLQNKTDERPTMETVVAYLEGRMKMESPPTPTTRRLAPLQDHDQDFRRNRQVGFEIDRAS